MSRSYSSTEKQAASPVWACVAHHQPVEIEARARLHHERRGRAETIEIRRRRAVHDVRIRIGVGRQIDFGAGDVKEAERPVGGQASRLCGVHDIVGHVGDIGRNARFGTQSQEGINRSHGNSNYRRWLPGRVGGAQ